MTPPAPRPTPARTDAARVPNVSHHWWSEVRTWAIECTSCGIQWVHTGTTSPELPDGWRYDEAHQDRYGNAPVYCQACAAACHLPEMQP